MDFQLHYLFSRFRKKLDRFVESSGNIENQIGATKVDNADTTLQHLGQLASEYQRKFQELEEFAQTAQPQTLTAQVRALGERTTDRFRFAQQGLLTLLTQHPEADQQQFIDALMALSSCFDEMRILFQITLQRLDSTPE